MPLEARWCHSFGLSPYSLLRIEDPYESGYYLVNLVPLTSHDFALKYVFFLIEIREFYGWYTFKNGLRQSGLI